MPPVKALVVGAGDIIRTLEEAGTTLSKQAIRRGLYAGAVVFRDEARLRAPVRTGALRKALVAETRGRSPDAKGRPTYHVGRVTVAKKAYTVGRRGTAVTAKKMPGQTRKYLRGQIYPRNYAHLVEFGTQPHGVGRGVMHPGSEPKPFMRPAYDTKRQEAMAAVERVLRQELLKIVAKRSKGGRRR